MQTDAAAPDATTAPVPVTRPVEPTTPSSERRSTTQRNRIQCKQEIIVSWLQEFYSRPGNLERILPVLRSESAVSLRLVDWFVTNYAKKHNVSYVLGQRNFLVYFHYKRELKAYSKRVFDPFCRRERILFQARGHEAFVTTIGQLNFFRWALEKGIMEYVEAHRATIEADMNHSIREHYARTESSTGSEGANSANSSGSDGLLSDGGASTAHSLASTTTGSSPELSAHSGDMGMGKGKSKGKDKGSSANSSRTEGFESSVASSRSSSGRRRRSELSKSALKKVNFHTCNVVVSFA